MKKIKILLAVLIVSSTAFAQIPDSTSIDGKNQKLDSLTKREFSFKTGWSAGLNTYLVAPGAVIGKTIIKDKLHARFGFNAYSIDIPSALLKSVSPSDSVKVGANFRINRGFFALDYQIKGILHLTAGAQYNDFGGQIVFALNNDFAIDTVASINGKPTNITITFTKEQIGNIRVDIEPAKFAPFVGIALGRTVPNRKIGFRFETGLVFQGAMKATLQEKIIYSGFKDVNDNDIVYNIGGKSNPDPNNQAILDAIADVNKSLSKFNFLPYISFSLNYKIK